VPSDILGTRIYRASRESFDVELGPVMANLVLADEINRAPAKVQSALLEVMAEGQVSIGGRSYPAPRPFLVLATQNPDRERGVYQLPEAQRDRFLMRVVVDYPGEAGRAGHPLPDGRGAADRPPGARHRQAHRPAGPGAGRLRAPRARRVRGALVLATRDPAVRLPSGASCVRRQPARHARPGRRRPGARPAARPRLRAAGRPLDIAPDVLAHRLVLSFDAVADGVAARAVVRRIVDACRCR
jgi:MoxR-like ATPase